jgi:MarC family membrane protein
MDLSFVSATLLLFFVLDPLGNIPLFVTALQNVDPKRRTRVVLRECVIAFVVLILFLFFGQKFMQILNLSKTSLGIAGGVILFLIALRIIFRPKEGIFGDFPGDEPFIVPLAVPSIAGPSALATVLLLVSRAPERILEWAMALTLAVAISTSVLALGSQITQWLGVRGVMALERLMGLILTAIAVEMFLQGIEEFIMHLRKTVG